MPPGVRLLDRMIEYVSPDLALSRARARAILAASGAGSGYVGADRTRRPQRFWRTRPTSADEATLPDLVDLRAASRDLARNNPLGGGAINTVTTAVVGTGLGVQPQVRAKFLRMSDDQAREWQGEARQLFEMWAGNALWCDITGRQTFYELQELAFRSALESGDAFALLPMERVAGEPFATKVQLIEADRVCNPHNRLRDDRLAGGIEINDAGRPVQCWIARKHPGGLVVGGNEWGAVQFFGARTGRRNVLHLVQILRPGQRRGVPYLAPVIEPLKQLGDYTDAEITAAVISGMFAVFVKKEVGSDGAPPVPMAAESVAPGTTAQNELRISSGAIIDLAEGEDVAFANPMRPNAAFDPFVQAILRQIGVALELPFEVLIKHFTASYSAARGAMLEAWRFYRKRRAWLAAQFCQPVYEAVIWEAVAEGRLSAPGFLRDPMVRAAYLTAEWIGDAPGHINPLQEANAAKVRIETGISSRQKESVAYDGSNWEENHQQIAQEEAARKKDGIAASPPTGPAGAPVPANDNTPRNEPEPEPNPAPEEAPEASAAAVLPPLHISVQAPITMPPIHIGGATVQVPDGLVQLEAMINTPEVKLGDVVVQPAAVVVNNQPVPASRTKVIRNAQGEMVETQTRPLEP